MELLGRELGTHWAEFGNVDADHRAPFSRGGARELARRGHPVKTAGDLDGPCSVEIIRRDAATGMLLAGSDPRRDDWALAW